MYLSARRHRMVGMLGGISICCQSRNATGSEEEVWQFLLPEISLGWLDKILTRCWFVLKSNECSELTVIDLDLLAFCGRFAMASTCQDRGHTSTPHKVHVSSLGSPHLMNEGNESELQNCQNRCYVMQLIGWAYQFWGIAFWAKSALMFIFWLLANLRWIKFVKLAWTNP